MASQEQWLLALLVRKQQGRPASSSSDFGRLHRAPVASSRAEGQAAFQALSSTQSPCSKRPPPLAAALPALAARRPGVSGAAEPCAACAPRRSPHVLPDYNGSLLRQALDLATRMLPAFDTASGLPSLWVNLAKGQNPTDTNVTCTACAGTLLLEFGVLSALTGGPSWARLGWAGLGWAGLGWAGLGWAGLEPACGIWASLPCAQPGSPAAPGPAGGCCNEPLPSGAP
jgi:hypothetical protein